MFEWDLGNEGNLIGNIGRWMYWWRPWFVFWENYEVGYIILSIMRTWSLWF